MVSIIVQGQLHTRLLKSIPNYLRFGNVILSTWTPENTELLDKLSNFDIQITHSELKEYEWFNRGNIYRQIYTVCRGLKLAKSEYTIKVRTDCYYENLQPIIDKLQPNKLICSDFMYNAFPLQMGDYIIAGQTRELIKMFRLAKILCESTPKETGGGFPDPRWFNLDFPPPTESILFGCYLHSKQIYPERVENILQKHTITVSNDELAPYYMVSNGLKLQYQKGYRE